MVVNDSASTHLEGSSRIAPAVDRTTPSVDDWADVFGPSAYDIVPDRNRNRKLGRVHLPDVLIGHNQYITDRVDGLITDATNSPFTTIILPYQYLEDPDRKLEWNGTPCVACIFCVTARGVGAAANAFCAAVVLTSGYVLCSLAL